MRDETKHGAESGGKHTSHTSDEGLALIAVAAVAVLAAWHFRAELLAAALARLAALEALAAHTLAPHTGWAAVGMVVLRVGAALGVGAAVMLATSAVGNRREAWSLRTRRPSVRF